MIPTWRRSSTSRAGCRTRASRRKRSSPASRPACRAREKVYAACGGEERADEGAFMADSQVPWGLEALTGTISEAAWRSKPSWYLVTTEDRMIPPQHQRWMSERAGMTVEEAAGSHAIYVSRPDGVAALIEKAASEVRSAAP